MTAKPGATFERFSPPETADASSAVVSLKAQAWRVSRLFEPGEPVQDDFPFGDDPNQCTGLKLADHLHRRWPYNWSGPRHHPTARDEGGSTVPAGTTGHDQLPARMSRGVP